MQSYGKLALVVALLLGVLIWLAASGVGEAMSYYKTIGELRQMGQAALGKRLRVAGDVEPGSLRRQGAEIRFTLVHDGLRLPVVYRGLDPLPDTVRDGAQAVADGKMGADGVFQASRVQAKCASKYEAAPGRPAGAGPNGLRSPAM